MSEQKITAWSYSRYSAYSQCPLKVKLTAIDKLREPSSPALENGTKVHAELEAYLKTPDATVPQSAIKLCADVEELKARKAYAELEVCFDDQWQPVDWFAKNAFARIKIDALVKEDDYAWVCDFKTGRVSDGYDPQLELYALTALLMFPTVNTVDTSLLFLDAGKRLDGQQYTRDDLEMLKAKWLDRVEPMLTDTEFLPTPNQYCKWCAFRKSNGGPCPA